MSKDGAHCNFIDGKCEYGDEPKKCRRESAVACRLRREKLEKEGKE